MRESLLKKIVEVHPELKPPDTSIYCDTDTKLLMVNGSPLRRMSVHMSRERLVREFGLEEREALANQLLMVDSDTNLRSFFKVSSRYGHYFFYKIYNKVLDYILFGASLRSFSRLLKCIIIEHFARCYPKPLQNRFLYSKTIGPRMLEANSAKLQKNKPLLEQLELDGLLHLAPMVMLFGQSPSGIRELVGKGLWKKLARNSLTRNYYLYRIFHEETLNRVEPGSFARVLRGLNELPSKVLQQSGLNLTDVLSAPGSEIFIRDNAPKLAVTATSVKHEIFRNMFVVKLRRLCSLVNDTRRMWNLLQLDEQNISRWSVKHLEEVHNTLVLEYRARKTRNQKVWAPLEDFEDGDYSVKFLRDTNQYIEEGVKMHHCVASYASMAVEREYIAASIRYKEERFSTIGFKVIETNSIRMDQHYMACNKQVKYDDTLRRIERDIVRKFANPGAWEPVLWKMVKEGSYEFRV